MTSFPPVVALPDWHQRQRERDDKVRRLKFNRQIMTTGGDHPSAGHLNVTRDALCLSQLAEGDDSLTAEGWRELLRSGCLRDGAAAPPFPEPLSLDAGASASVPESEVSDMRGMPE